MSFDYMLVRSCWLPKLGRSFALLEYYGLQKRFGFILLLSGLMAFESGCWLRVFGLVFVKLAFVRPVFVRPVFVKLALIQLVLRQELQRTFALVPVGIALLALLSSVPLESFGLLMLKAFTESRSYFLQLLELQL
jgi:hypothetical protein